MDQDPAHVALGVQDRGGSRQGLALPARAVGCALHFRCDAIQKRRVSRPQHRQDGDKKGRGELFGERPWVAAGGRLLAASLKKSGRDDEVALGFPQFVVTGMGDEVCRFEC